jgi:hypothetical protein
MRYHKDGSQKSITPSQFNRKTLHGKLPYVAWWLRASFHLVTPASDNPLTPNTNPPAIGTINASPEAIGAVSGYAAAGAWGAGAWGSGPRMASAHLAPESDGPEIELRTALELFPEKLTREEVDQLERQLAPNGRASLRVYETRQNNRYVMAQLRDKYRTQKAKAAKGAFKRLKAEAFYKLPMSRKLGHIAQWADIHFTGSEARLSVTDLPNPVANIFRQPMARDGEPNTPGASGLNTKDMLQYFPFSLTEQEIEQAIREIGTPRGEKSRFTYLEARWHLRHEFTFDGLQYTRSMRRRTVTFSEPRTAEPEEFRDLDLTNENSREKFRSLSHVEQTNFIEIWFRYNYVNAEETVPITDKGELQFSYGGPYNAADEISARFTDLTAQEVIAAGIQRISILGVPDWVPSFNHPERRRLREAYDVGDEVDMPPPHLDDILAAVNGGEVIDLTTEKKRKLAEEVGKAADEFLAMLESDRPEHGAIGHNQPPNENLSLGKKKLAASARKIKKEVKKKSPSAKIVAKETSNFRRTLTWIGKQCGDVGVHFKPAFGKSLGTWMGRAFGATATAIGVGVVNSAFPLISNLMKLLGLG